MSNAQATKLAECESILAKLVQKLYSENNLGASLDPDRVKSLKNMDACYISGKGKSESSQWIAHRGNDNLTVFFENRDWESGSEFYGPFKSAYRK